MIRSTFSSSPTEIVTFGGDDASAARCNLRLASPAGSVIVLRNFTGAVGCWLGVRPAALTLKWSVGSANSGAIGSVCIAAITWSAAVCKLGRTAGSSDKSAVDGDVEFELRFAVPAACVAGRISPVAIGSECAAATTFPAPRDRSSTISRIVWLANSPFETFSRCRVLGIDLTAGVASAFVGSGGAAALVCRGLRR